MSTSVVGKLDCAATSRSTSAGSHDDGRVAVQHQVHGTDGRYTGHLQKSGMPDYDYPVPTVVRNTFIELQVGRPTSLDEFFEERRIRSCPVPPREEERDVCSISTPEPVVPQYEQPRNSIATGAQALFSTVAIVTGFSPRLEHAASATPSDKCNAWAERPRLLMLSEALPGPTQPFPLLPTVGSAGHSSGTCKPCAFLYTKGCGNGAQCSFCHLCPPDEKRRRQKDKQAAMRLQRQRKIVSL